MSLDKALKSMKFDNRLQNYNLTTGVINNEEIKKHNESLPDLSEQAIKIKFEDISKDRDNDSDQH